MIAYRQIGQIFQPPIHKQPAHKIAPIQNMVSATGFFAYCSQGFYDGELIYLG